MEGFETPIAQETDLIRRNEKLESAGQIIETLFNAVGDNAIKRIMADPTYEGLTERR